MKAADEIAREHIYHDHTVVMSPRSCELLMSGQFPIMGPKLRITVVHGPTEENFGMRITIVDSKGDEIARLGDMILMYGDNLDISELAHAFTVRLT